LSRFIFENLEDYTVILCRITLNAIASVEAGVASMRTFPELMSAVKAASAADPVKIVPNSLIEGVVPL
tara:strand:+ start:291 stop:494 length:204 start_codon:yes stop_codon:yes gene_type:complete